MAAHRNLLRPVIWSNHISDNHINSGKHEAWHQLIQPLLQNVHSNRHRRTSLPTRITVYNGVRLVHYISSYSEFRNHIIDGLYSVDNRQDLQRFHHADQLIISWSMPPPTALLPRQGHCWPGSPQGSNNVDNFGALFVQTQEQPKCFCYILLWSEVVFSTWN